MWGGVRAWVYEQMEMLLGFQSASANDILWHAIQNDNDWLAQYAVSKRDINLEVKDEELERTPLLRAAFFGKTKCLNVLLEAGANDEAQDKTGRTALHLAACAGNVACLKALLNHSKSNINEKDKGENTPVHSAVIWNQMDCLIELCDAGADITIPNKQKRTPFQTAQKIQHLEMIQFLGIMQLTVDASKQYRITGTGNHHPSISSSSANSSSAQSMSLSNSSITDEDVEDQGYGIGYYK